MKAFIALLVFCTCCFAQGPPDPEPPQVSPIITIDQLGRIVYNTSELPEHLVLGTLDPTRPVIFIGSVGDSTGVAKQLYKNVVIDRDELVALPTAAIEIIAAPGAGRFIIPRYMVLRRMGMVGALDPATDGQAIPTMGFGTETSGFLSRALGAPGDFNIWDRSGITIRQALLAEPENHFSNIPSGFESIRLRENTPLMLYPTTLGIGTHATEQESWEANVNNAATDYMLTITIYYQIFDIR